MPTSAQIADLERGLPSSRLLTDPSIIAQYAHDRENAPWQLPAAVVRPRSTDEVVEIVRWANACDCALIPRGAGSGLTGGSNASAESVVVTLEKMNSIVEVNPVEQLAVVQPGVINQTLREEAANHQLWYPPDPASKNFCSLGGNVATNAGGLCCLRYGVTRDHVLQLEVVSGAGDRMVLGERTAKNSVGYDLTRLFVGSEGTLGIITQMTLRLRPLPTAPATVVGGFRSSPEAADAAIRAIRADGVQASLCELIDEYTLRAVDELLDLELPSDVSCLVLIQVSGSEHAAAVEGAFCSAGAVWTLTAPDLQSGEMLLEARRRAFDAVSVRGNVTTEDICVPVSAVGSVVAGVHEISRRCEVPIAVVAHVGDGNLHPMIIDDGTVAASSIELAFEKIMWLAIQVGGTVSGEHGVGVLKRRAARTQLGSSVVAINSQIKQVFDPRGIMNPGKGVSDADRRSPVTNFAGLGQS